MQQFLNQKSDPNREHARRLQRRFLVQQQRQLDELARKGDINTAIRLLVALIREEVERESQERGPIPFEKDDDDGPDDLRKAA